MSNWNGEWVLGAGHSIAVGTQNFEDPMRFRVTDVSRFEKTIMTLGIGRKRLFGRKNKFADIEIEVAHVAENDLIEDSLDENDTDLLVKITKPSGEFETAEGRFVKKMGPQYNPDGELVDVFTVALVSDLNPQGSPSP